MIKEEYKNLPDTEFVPLTEGIDPVFFLVNMKLIKRERDKIFQI